MKLHIENIRFKGLLTVLFTILITLPSNSFAGNGDEFITVNAGYLYNNTLNASIGWEYELPYDNAIEIFADAGNHPEKDPICGKVCSKSFWDGYYWDGGLVYKKSLHRWRNSSLRFNAGPVFGAWKSDFFYGVEGSFEWSYTFRSGCKFVLKQKNNISFRRGDTFRNGITIGFKVPL